MMDHIVAHSIQVCRVAMLLAGHLASQGMALNRELVQAAALLHDITKTRSFKTGENHAFTGDQLVSGMGYIEVGDIVRQHVRLDTYENSGNPTEAEIVNYADKRILHDKIVPLRERLNYILEKYGTEPEILERIQWTWQRTRQLEEKIFNTLPFLPADISPLLPPEELSREMSAYRSNCFG